MLFRRKCLQVSLSRFIFPSQSFSTKSAHRRGLEFINDEELKRKDEKYIHLCKSKGQHLLTNQRILDTIVQRSNIKRTDTVLEIGPGTGNLTLKLLKVAEKVVAVEIDQRLVGILQERIAEVEATDRLNIICGDALKMKFPPFDIVVANIPYQISSPLVAKLLFGGYAFRSATIMFQKEFAERLAANPGDSEYNRLAVNVRLFADVEFVMNVKKGNFVPRPRVDSSVVMIRPKAVTSNVDLQEWSAFTRTCFNTKNKTMNAILTKKRKMLGLLRLYKQVHCTEECTKNVCDEGNEDEDEDEGDCDLSLFRERIVGVLKSGKFHDLRPLHMCNEQLLDLLSSLNKAGVFFHDHRAKSPADLLDAESSDSCDL